MPKNRLSSVVRIHHNANHRGLLATALSPRPHPHPRHRLWRMARHHPSVWQPHSRLDQRDPHEPHGRAHVRVLRTVRSRGLDGSTDRKAGRRHRACSRREQRGARPLRTSDPALSAVRASGPGAHARSEPDRVLDVPGAASLSGPGVLHGDGLRVRRTLGLLHAAATVAPPRTPPHEASPVWRGHRFFDETQFFDTLPALNENFLILGQFRCARSNIRETYFIVR